jgi:CheY-like chemotaxis protein
MKPTSPLKVVFADDDEDDHFIFAKTLDEIFIPTELVCFDSSEVLINFLEKNFSNLPDVIFLDLNMPRVNGLECLIEIKRNERLEHIPIVIYSTSFQPEILDLLYKADAYNCILKSSNYKARKEAIISVFESIRGNRVKLKRSEFVLVPVY